MLSVSLVAAAGGMMMYALVPDGPYLTAGAGFDPGALLAIFRSPGFRASAVGYFGHMWELYAMWAWFLAFATAAQSGADDIGARRDALEASVGVSSGVVLEHDGAVDVPGAE